MKTIECSVHGQVQIEVEKIDWIRTVFETRNAPPSSIAQIKMKDGTFHYVRGKDRDQLADDLGIVALSPVG